MKLKTFFMGMFFTGMILIPAYGIPFNDLALGLSMGAFVIALDAIFSLIWVFHILDKKFNIKAQN